jgi:hypothetical protein
MIRTKYKKNILLCTFYNIFYLLIYLYLLSRIKCSDYVQQPDITPPPGPRPLLTFPRVLAVAAK